MLIKNLLNLIFKFVMIVILIHNLDFNNSFISFIIIKN